MSFITDFLAILLLAFTVNLVLYYLLGLAIIALSKRYPHKKIQPNRDGMKRARTEMYESLWCILTTSTCLALALSLQIHGYTLWQSWGGLIGTTASVLLIFVLYDAWFYWAHRALHTRMFYRFHKDHHRALAPTVWSADSQSPVETAMCQSFLVVAAVFLPVSQLAIIIHRVWDHVNSQIGHSGFEFFADRTTRYPSPFICTTFHDQHHEKFKYNFANYFSVWDRVMGTIAPDYDSQVAKIAKVRQ